MKRKQAIGHNIYIDLHIYIYRILLDNQYNCEYYALLPAPNLSLLISL